MDSVMLQYGESVATEVFANYFYSEAHTVAVGLMDGTYAGPPIGATAGLSTAATQRFGALTGALQTFYQGGQGQADALGSPGGWFGPSNMGVHAGIHKGNDFGLPLGTDIAAVFSGRISSIDRIDNYNSITGADSSGKDVAMELGFDFENTFLNIGVNANAFHFSAIPETLRTGLYVGSGHIVGDAGSTGASTGSHLHQEFTLAHGYGAPTSTAPNPYRLRQEAFLNFVGAPSLNITTPDEVRLWTNGDNFWHLDRSLFYINANGWFGGN